MSCIWNPWRGCHRCSEGCKFCYIHKGDAKRGRNTNEIVKSENFYRMVEKKKRTVNYGYYRKYERTSEGISE